MPGLSSAPVRAWKMCPVLIAATFLAACATEISDTVTLCRELVVYTPEFQAEAANEMDALAPGAALGVLMEDYLHLRDQLRAGCGQV
jgi:hypothetical protein